MTGSVVIILSKKRLKQRKGEAVLELKVKI